MQGNRLRTLQLMRENATHEMNKFWKKYDDSKASQDRLEFEKAQQRLRNIEKQIKTFRQTSPNLSVSNFCYSMESNIIFIFLNDFFLF